MYCVIYKHKGKLWLEWYTTESAAMKDVRKAESAVIIYDASGAKNYGLIEDMIDHSNEL